MFISIFLESLNFSTFKMWKKEEEERFNETKIRFNFVKRFEVSNQSERLTNPHNLKMRQLLV